MAVEAMALGGNEGDHSRSAKARAAGSVRQPVEVLQLDAALLRLKTVTAVTGLSSSTIYRMVVAGTFPAPVRFGRRCSRWPSRQVRDWLQLQVARAAA